jgi:midasin
MALEALSLLARALTQLEVGELGIIRFGEDVRLLHPFDQVTKYFHRTHKTLRHNVKEIFFFSPPLTSILQPFNDAAGAHVISQFTFRQSRDDFSALLETVVQYLEISRNRGVGGIGPERMQLVLIVSDGYGLLGLSTFFCGLSFFMCSSSHLLWQVARAAGT